MSSAPFSILIPSWNNLPYLKLCVESIRKNSSLQHQIIVHVNEGADGTLIWVEQNGIEHTFSLENIGICKALNAAALLVRNEFIVYMNDDMYVCPDWDKFLSEEIEHAGNQSLMLSATMIEPRLSKNPCVLVRDFGDSLENFCEEKLLSAKLEKPDWCGASWAPVLVPAQLWNQVGGMSEEFSPGMYSDPDLSMKLWRAGCRIFKGVGKSKVYHFQCKTTGRIEKNDGRKTFLLKWGILPSFFYKHYLRMGEPWKGILNEPKKNLRFRLQKIRAGMLKRFTKENE